MADGHWAGMKHTSFPGFLTVSLVWFAVRFKKIQNHLFDFIRYGPWSMEGLRLEYFQFLSTAVTLCN